MALPLVSECLRRICNMGIQNPPGFNIETEAQKAASANGFRLERGIESGWLHYVSTTAEGEIWIAAVSSHGPWFLSLSHEGVTKELRANLSPNVSGPGLKTFVFDTLPDLYMALEVTYRLSISLPDVPLKNFQKEVHSLPRTTEAERLVIQRLGQNLFRNALLEYWGGKCPLTSISDTSLLRASHIVAWAECESDYQRLDVHNGLLLSALWDAAFDKGLISFTNDGTILVSDNLSQEARQALGIEANPRLTGLTEAHHMNLTIHRKHYGF
jgi:hypothetical protein